MAKTTAPLLSFGASGQIAKSLVASKWKGRPYMRRHVIPANPQTTAQTSTRDIFAWLSNVYRNAPADVTDVWKAFATGQVLTDRNAFMGHNVQAMRNAGGAADTDLTNFIFSDGAKGGPVPGTFTVTPGVGQLTLAVADPSTTPTGWTVTEAVFAIIADQNPASGLLFDITAATDASSPYSSIFTGLSNTQLYQCAAWLKWTKPDGTFAYSANLRDTGTPT